MKTATHYSELALACARGYAIRTGNPALTDDDIHTPLSALTPAQQERILAAGEAGALPLRYFKRSRTLPRVEWALGVLRGMQPASLLDIGSGRGTFLWPLLDALPHLPVTAVDADPRRAELLAAVQAGGVERLTARLADATALPFPDRSFDVVSLLEVLEHIPDAESALAECVRVCERALLITYHLPWSPGISDDDRALPNTSYFEERRMVVTVKMDGEQTTMYTDYLHARSLEWTGHPSRSWVANLHGQMGWKIPPGWRVCGENLYAKHSIHYQHLPSYFQLFSVWDERNVCLSWDETLEWAALLDLPTVPVLYDGLWDGERIRRLYTRTFDGDEMEGYVVRLADSFAYGAFRHSVAKFVRADHIRTRRHWFHGQPVVPNRLNTEESVL